MVSFPADKIVMSKPNLPMQYFTLETGLFKDREDAILLQHSFPIAKRDSVATQTSSHPMKIDEEGSNARPYPRHENLAKLGVGPISAFLSTGLETSDKEHTASR